MNINERRDFYNKFMLDLNQELDSLDFTLSIPGSRDPYLSGILNTIGTDKIIKKYSFMKEIKIFVITWAKLLIHSFILRKSSSIKSISTQEDIILIDTFILPSAMNSTKYLDRYYSNFRTLLPTEINSSCLYLPTLIGKYSFEQIINFNRMDIRYICKEDLLCFSDYIFAFFHIFRMKKVATRIKEMDWIQEPLKLNLLTEIRNSYFNFSSITALLNYRFAKRLKESSLNIKLLIDWHENQVVDKGINKGFSEHLPTVKRKGYQGFCVDPDFNFHMAPNEYEFRNNFIPNEITVTGPALVNPLKRFCNEIIVSPAPAFRFSHLFDHSFQIKDSSSEILVGLPISDKESRMIVEFIERVCQKFPDSQFIIKQHPSSTWSYTPQSSNVCLSSEQTGCILERAELLISATSSLCLEAIAKAVPVIIISQKDEDCQRPIPKDVSSRMWCNVDNINKLNNSIKSLLKYSQTNPKEREEIARDILSSYFEEPTKENVLYFFT